MRLFTALWPSTHAVRHLSEQLRALSPGQVTEATAGLRKFRFVPPERWHLTLCFHGDGADEDQLGRRLDNRIARFVRKSPDPPRLRLAGAGVFRTVLWVGVEAAEDTDAAALRGLARAAGADPHSFRAHVTVARWSEGRPDRALLHGFFDRYAGPWWSVGEIALVRSDQGKGAHTYSTVHRAALISDAPGDTESSGCS